MILQLKAQDEVQAQEKAHAHVPIFPVHFSRTFSMQSLGPYDPTAESAADLFRKAFFYRGEPAALEFRRDQEGLLVTAYAPEAEALLEETLAGLSQDDRYRSFATVDGGIWRLHRSQPGLRLLRFPWLYEMTCSAILQQRIRTVDAMRDWRHITQRWGVPAPLGLRAFPSAEILARVAQFELQALDIDAQRARTLLRFAQESRFVPLKTALRFAELRERLIRIPGVGPWTTESVLGYGAGDADAAIPGDLHLPHLICYALAGEIPGSDERMMELLEPFRGHRFRIIRLIYASGIAVPRSTPHAYELER
jgi:3-methyladenine DNA glycosylase/8-oxoguanine DNA glycosylase